MAIGYLLINVNVGKENDVLKELKTLPSVKETYFVSGLYDIVAKVETGNAPELKELVKKIRRLEYVRSTLTMISMEEK